MKTTQQEERWAAIRCLVERCGAPIYDVALAAKLSPQRLEKLAADNGWKLLTGNTILTRLRSLLALQIGELENIAKQGGGLDEKFARTLGTLARTWEKLTDLETTMAEQSLSQTGFGGEPAKSLENVEIGGVDLESLREELERRIVSLVERKAETDICPKSFDGKSTHPSR